jgi:GH24 family phage-related lysozyme (muramidase)
MRARLKVSRAGVELIKSFEGLRQTAARLPDGRWTLGYGHTFSAREGATVTQEDADALLRFDLLPIVDAINNLVLTPLNQNQFDSLVSFCFNIGADNFAVSSVLKRINEGRMTEAALAMDSWRSAEFNGQTYVLAPLIRRRAAEKNLFLTPDEAGGNAPSLLVRPVEDGGDVSAQPSEVDAPTTGGILSARPLGAEPAPTLPPPYAQPALNPSPYASPIPPVTPVPVQPVAPAATPERQVIDLASFAPRAADPVSEPTAFTPKPTIVRMADVEPTAPAETVVEHLPFGAVPSSVRETPVEEAPTSFEPNPVAAMSPEMQQAIARAQDELRFQEEARQRDAARLEQERLEAARQEQLRIEQARIEQERLQREDQIRAELARAEAVRMEQQRLEREAQERARIELEAQERARQEQIRLEFEAQERARAEQQRLEQERLDRERQAFEAQRAEQARQEQIRLEAERMERERQEQVRLDQEKLEQAKRDQAMQQDSTVPGLSPEEAEKQRKAEAAAAMMRLYSPYGGGRLGLPLKAADPVPLEPKPASEPSRDIPVQVDTVPFVEISRNSEPEKPIGDFHVAPPVMVPPLATHEPEPEPAADPETRSAEPIHLQFRPQPSASSMPAPQVTALNPYARPIPQADVVEVPRPSAVDLSANTTVFRSEVPPQAPEQPLHWRDQLQRPLPQDYQTPPQTETPAASMRGVQTAMYDDGADDWHPDSGRIALSAEEMEQETVSVWRMITSTIWWILISAAGLACFGVAAASYFKAHQEAVARAGGVTFYTWLSIGTAATGILLVCVSVWLIMKRLGGLKD